jgi:hypothetical protein
MRLSHDRRDPGWEVAMERGIDMSCILVTVNGDSYRNIVTVDTDHGLAWIIALDDYGRPNHDRHGVLTRLVSGNVRIRFLARPDGSWPHHGVPVPKYPVPAMSWRKKV